MFFSSYVTKFLEIELLLLSLMCVNSLSSGPLVCAIVHIIVSVELTVKTRFTKQIETVKLHFARNDIGKTKPTTARPPSSSLLNQTWLKMWSIINNWTAVKFHNCVALNWTNSVSNSMQREKTKYLLIKTNFKKEKKESQGISVSFSSQMPWASVIGFWNIVRGRLKGLKSQAGTDWYS